MKKSTLASINISKLLFIFFYKIRWLAWDKTIFWGTYRETCWTETKTDEKTSIPKKQTIKKNFYYIRINMFISQNLTINQF